jgi:type VI secretion system protein ImpL
MKKLSFLASRWFLAFVALLLVAVGIWFIGPYIAFGGLKPLAGAAMRVLVIALLVAGVVLWLVGWTTSIVAGALLCLLIWYAAPLLTFGKSEPFVPVAARVIAIAVVIALFLAWGLLRLMHRMRHDEAFLKKALSFGDTKEPSPAAGRIRDLETRFNTVLGRLKDMRTGARGVGRLFQGTRYLYELPWYIALGSNASGKTSALLNAGLRFPVGTPMARTGVAPAGTRNVDWWLTNEAVLIDTAGYYTRHGTQSQSLPALTGNAGSTGSSSTDVRASARSNSHVSDARTDVAQRQGDDPGARTGAITGATGSADAQERQHIDEDEWQGFLGLLRRHRPRAPINGAILAVSVNVLTDANPAVRASEADALRARLAELRSTLGIRFPVYLLITQMDRMPGFAEYFSSLTEESRAQMWGFTLALGRMAGNMADHAARAGLAAQCSTEFAQLAARLAGGVNTRLEDEYDPERRRRLVVLAEGFAALGAPLADLLGQIFSDSRYDSTEIHASLRGVYFTSATQRESTVVAEPLTIVQRLSRGLARPLAQSVSRSASNQGYFLRDIFTKVIFPEAYLVRPNLRWEYRLRFLRLLGHALALLLFVWLAIGLRVSFGNNTDYLDAVGRKTQALAAKVTALYRTPNPEAIPDTLSDARYLPTLTGLDLSAPDGSYRYGLYTAPDVVSASQSTYRALENNLLVPQIVHRLEDVIAQSMAAKDAKGTYDALRVYLMFYEKARFSAPDAKAWVLDDWAKTDSASIFGGRASMIGHVEQLFSGEEPVQSPLIRNDALIQQARAFLDSSNATQRLYDRAKADMQKAAPDEFTLLRAVGPQAGTVFTRGSGAPLSRGVPGLFTFDGYRNLFDKRLREFTNAARDDDAWVMGRSYLGEAQKKRLSWQVPQQAPMTRLPKLSVVST